MFRWARPWRGAGGWGVTALALLAGVPLFLCMPPWNDVTLHDMAVRAMLRGGVHYRDVFDTNLPGIDWAMAAVRYLFGWSYEVLRAVDLIVIGATAAVLCGFVRRCGGTGYAVAWFVAAIVLFYPFQSEFTHVQRDPWMLLPAVVAARLRLRRVRREEPDPTPNPLPQGERGLSAPPSFLGKGAGGLGFFSSVLEGFVWGLAVWVKPHVVVPAFAVWAVSAVLLARREPRRRILMDLAGLLLGGLLAGVPGVVWLIASGAWPHFCDIFLNWNPAYLSESGSLAVRGGMVFGCFRPWSVLHFAALPLAVLALWESRVWSRRPGAPAPVFGTPHLYLRAETESVASARAILAAFYLAWLAQAVLIQKPFDYVHTPLTFLGMAVIAGQRWCFGFAFLVWFGAVGVLATGRGVEAHPLLDRRVMTLWPRCWTEGGSPELRDKLGYYTTIHLGTRWQELEPVAGYLRTVDPPLRAGELNCWHDSTHPLYLMLDLDPATRYMHYGTAFGIKSKREVIADEVRASRQKYVVSDLLRTTWSNRAVYAPDAWRDGDPLPVWLPAAERQKFPWNQPVVFRSGRYVVHKIRSDVPLGTIRVPDWDKLDRLDRMGPDE